MRETKHAQWGHASSFFVCPPTQPVTNALEASLLGEKVVADGSAVLGEGLVLVAAGLAVVLW